jgi:hypothetical protein
VAVVTNPRPWSGGMHSSSVTSFGRQTTRDRHPRDHVPQCPDCNCRITTMPVPSSQGYLHSRVSLYDEDLPLACATCRTRARGDDLTAPWTILIRQCLREGAPWYVLMQVVPVQGVAHRRAYRVLSRGTALSKRRHWGVAVDTIQANLLPDGMARAAQRFGVTSCRLYDAQKMARSSGQPVLLCYRVVASRSTASRLPVSGPWPPDSTASRRRN